MKKYKNLLISIALILLSVSMCMTSEILSDESVWYDFRSDIMFFSAIASLVYLSLFIFRDLLAGKKILIKAIVGIFWIFFILICVIFIIFELITNFDSRHKTSGLSLEQQMQSQDRDTRFGYINQSYGEEKIIRNTRVYKGNVGYDTGALGFASTGVFQEVSFLGSKAFYRRKLVCGHVDIIAKLDFRIVDDYHIECIIGGVSETVKLPY